MIVDERFVIYINSLNTGNTPFLEELEKKGESRLCTDYPPGNAEPVKITTGDEAPGPDTGSRNGGRIFCITDGRI